MAAIIELANITKTFGGVRAVDAISFSVEPGELMGLIGPNGAGKTTVFNLITGVYDPDQGNIVFDGVDITPLRAYEVIRRGIARTFQNLRLFQRSTVLENVMTAAQNGFPYAFWEGVTHLGRWRGTERKIRERSMELLDRVGLADRALQDAGTLP